MEIENLLNKYYKNDATRIRNIVDKILSKFGGLSQMDYDDFYSLSNEVFFNIYKNYDNSQDFEGYLYSCLSNKIKSEITKRNRFKRKADRLSISIDTSLNEENDFTIADTLVSDINVETEVLDSDFMNDKEVKDYLNSLSNIQRKIIELKMQGMQSIEIKEKINLSNKEYDNHCNQIKSFSKVQFLFRSNSKLSNIYIEEEKVNMGNNLNNVTLEKSKPDRLSIRSIVKRIDNFAIRFDHPLQRESEQWSPSMKSNLISDILQDNPIPALVFAEQVVNGIAIIWDLDGKQRCTNVYSYIKDGYKISKNIRRYNISYQTVIRDENGKHILDNNGFPQYRRQELDIRGKRFSDLPEELQENLLDYNFEIIQYLNCSSEDIAYHIARYNEGKPMTASQKGITRLGEKYASIVKSISSMEFFKDKGGYKISEFKNGTINRVVIESIMAANFLEDWKKKQEEMAEYIKDNATESHFDEFEEVIERLSKVVTDEVADMFNSKDSFLWFGLFARFNNTGLGDEKFVEFMTEFGQSLHNAKVNEFTFEELNTKGTKDKNLVIAKMELLTILMSDYFNIKDVKSDNIQDENKKLIEEIINKTNISIEELKQYIKDFEDSNFIKWLEINKKDAIRLAVESLKMISDCEVEGVMLYLDIVNDLSLNCDLNSYLFNKENVPVLIGLVNYSCLNEQDELLENWIVNYANEFKINDFGQDKIKNYIVIREHFSKYVEVEKQKIAL